MSPRLNAANLELAEAKAARPRPDLQKLPVGIVHLGLGAFHRAHQAPFTEDAVLAAGGDWGIAGVSLQHADTPNALNAQDGLYTVEVLDAAPAYRVIGVLRRALAARETPAAVIEAMAAPSTHLITLTVTEKAYLLAADGSLDVEHPDIAHDLARPAVPRSVVGWLARGLAERRERRAGPITVVPCDNLIGNGGKLLAAALTFARRADPGLERWIEGEAAFLSTMVDCMVPAATSVSRARIDAALALEDRASVSRETFAEWVIEDRFAGPRPAWERAGVELVADVAGHEQLKLRGLNAAHSALAYLGLARGFALVREAIADPALSGFLDGLFAEEIAPALPALPMADYWRRTRARFANPMLDHRLAQIAEDGSVKLAQRVLPLIERNARAGRPSPRLVMIVRTWLDLAAAGAVKDPQADHLADWGRAGADITAALDDPALFPDPFRRDPPVRAAMLEARL